MVSAAEADRVWRIVRAKMVAQKFNMERQIVDEAAVEHLDKTNEHHPGLVLTPAEVLVASTCLTAVASFLKRGKLKPSPAEQRLMAKLDLFIQTWAKDDYKGQQFDKGSRIVDIG